MTRRSVPDFVVMGQQIDWIAHWLIVLVCDYVLRCVTKLVMNNWKICQLPSVLPPYDLAAFQQFVVLQLITKSEAFLDQNFRNLYNKTPLSGSDMNQFNLLKPSGNFTYHQV
jgi:hypothetical protein